MTPVARPQGAVAGDGGGSDERSEAMSETMTATVGESRVVTWQERAEERIAELERETAALRESFKGCDATRQRNAEHYRDACAWARSDVAKNVALRGLLDAVREALGPTCADATHESLPGLVAEVVACDAAMHEWCKEQRMEVKKLRAEVAHLETRRGALLAEVDRLHALDRDAGVVIEDLRKMLAAANADVKRLRAFLPAETVVPCPACGVDITADLVDGAYVTRQHSRRAPRTVGLGDIVWCDGGVVRTVAR